MAKKLPHPQNSNEIFQFDNRKEIKSNTEFKIAAQTGQGRQFRLFYEKACITAAQKTARSIQISKYKKGQGPSG